jgi:hypothetical protein
MAGGFTIDRGGGGVGVLEGGGGGSPSIQSKKNSLSGLYATLNTINGTPNPGQLARFTGLPNGETRTPRGETVQMKEKVVFKSELHESLSLGLQNEIQRLVELTNSAEFGNARDQADMAAIWASPNFRPYRQLFDEYVRPEKNGSRLLKLDEAALQQYLSTDRGYIKTIAMAQVKMENMAAMAAAFVLGNLPTEGVGVINQRQGNYVTDARGGAGTEAVRGVTDWLRTPFRLHGREMPALGFVETQGGAVGWAALGGVLGGALGSAVIPGVGTVGGAALGASGAAAIEAAVYAISQGFRRSDRTFIRQTEEALLYAQSADMAADRTFAERMFGLSPKNWALDANGNVIVRPDIANNTHVATATLDPRTTRDILFGLDKLIKQAQKEVYGVQRQFRSSMRIAGRGQDAQRGILIEDDANEQFKRNLDYDSGAVIPGGVVDLAGNPVPLRIPCSILSPGLGEWVDNVGQVLVAVDVGVMPPEYTYYDAPPGGGIVVYPVPSFNTVPRDFAYERRIYRQAFLDVVSQGIASDIAMVREGKRDELANLAQIITGREGARADIIAARTSAIDEQDRLMGIDRESLDGDNGELRSFAALNGDPARVDADDRDKATLLEIDQQRRAEERASRNVRDNAGALVPDAVTELDTVLTHTYVPGGAPHVTQVIVDGRVHVIESIEQRKRDAEGVYDAAIAGLPAAPVGGTARAIESHSALIESSTRQAQTRLDRALAIIQRDEDLVIEARRAILDARTGVTRAQEALSHKAEERRAVQGTTEAMITARQDISSWSTPLIPPYPGNPAGYPANVLDIDALATLPLAELERRINLANTINNNWGWPAAENEQRRLDILHGKGEAIAAQDPLSPINAVTPDFRDVILRPTPATPGWGIEETVLLTSSTPQLTELFTNRLADLAALIPPIIPPGFAAVVGPPPLPAIPAGTIPDATRILNLQREAQLRFRARQRGLQQVVGIIDETMADNARERARVTTEVNNSPELRMIGEAAANVPKIIQTITEMPVQLLAEELRPALGNTQPEIYGVPGSAPGELTNEIGFNFIAGLLTNYMNAKAEFRNGGASGRIAAYQTISAFLTPAALSGLMFESPNLTFDRPAVVPPPYPPLNAILPGIQAALIDGRISRIQFANFIVRDIIGNDREGYMGPQAKAL